ncbi:hypothetical protein AB0K34_04950 [Actinomadura sp. NPDC049382]|uniref:hypothetical protein n=1 Tax=Actinomadura sp. NPDC049382 TaxID=3158220 RepID=UPI003429DC7B
MSELGGLSEAAATGSRLTALRALRDRLAAEIDAGPMPRDLAALSRQLTDVLAQIEALAPPEQKGTPLDELANRRAGRGATAPRAGRAAGQAQRR